MGHKISKEQIDPGVKDHIMSFVGDVADLETEVNTDIISAVNSLMVDRVDNAENMGKLANAIGEPVTANHSVDEVVEGLGEMLSTFKTNMMNSGVVVESSDKFKSLIDKIKGLTEGEGNKGVQFAEGDCEFTTNPNPTLLFEEYDLQLNTDFTPSILLLRIRDKNALGYSYEFIHAIIDSTVHNSQDSFAELVTSSPHTTRCYIDNNKFYAWSQDQNTYTVKWYAIGVGEEDTTLRDSLASILTEEGVSVTEEDDMASLISKVDEEFTNDNNTINEMEANNETNKQNLITALRNNGKELTGDESFEELVGMVEVEDGIILSPKDIKQIACGDFHTIILKNDDSLWSCGYNSRGQLGLGDTTDRTTFTKVTTNINNDVKQVACGNWYTMIVKNDGSLWACGYNYYGQLGLGDTTDRNTFTKVTTNINNDVEQIACGYYTTFILKNDGRVWSCGYNNYGQL